MAIDVSIIIINYNTFKYLLKCLESIYNHTIDISFEIIVIDNNSPERNIENVENLYPKIKIHYREVNDGFGAGCNYGASLSKGKYLLFINPDIVLSDNVVKDFYQYLESNSKVGVVSPFYIENNSLLFYTPNNFPDLEWQINEAFENVLIKIRSILKNPRENNNLFKSPIEVNWVMGSFIFIRRNLFDEVKGFDQNMFLYYEDIDLQLRINETGNKIVYHPDYKVYHYKRSSVRSFEGENLYYFHMGRSNLIYMYKHYNFFKRNIIRISFLISSILKIIILPLRKKYLGKRKQKLYQYFLIIKLFSSSKKHIYNNKFALSNVLKTSGNQIIQHDTFWKS